MKKVLTILFAMMTLSASAEWPSVMVDSLTYEIRNYGDGKVSVLATTLQRPDIAPWGDIVIKDHVILDGEIYDVDELSISIRYSGQKVILPNTIKSVISIGNGAKVENISESLENIFHEGLAGTELPEYVEMPSIKIIGRMAFAATKGVRKIMFGPNMSVIGIHAFLGSEVSEITFEEGVYNDYALGGSPFISNNAIICADNIKELKLPKWNNLTLGDCFVGWCENLERVVFPDLYSVRYGYCIEYSDRLIMDMDIPVYGYFFKDCPKLKEIVCMGETPIEITNIDNFKEKNQWVDNTAEEFTFMDNIDECVLKVPAGSEELYRAHPVWGRFQTILGFENGDYNLVSINSVEADKDATPVYYNLQGIQVKEPVKGQLYIRKAGAETTKVIL